MFISNPNQIKVGQTIWSGYDDRPFDGYGWCKAKVTEIFADHYLFCDMDNSISNIWGFYDTEPCSVANFTTEDEVLNWLRIGR